MTRDALFSVPAGPKPDRASVRVGMRRPVFAMQRASACIAAALLALCINSVSNAQGTPLRFGAKLSADSVMVGDPFILTVTVEVPAGARVTWPTPADSNGPIELREPVHVTVSDAGASTGSGNDRGNSSQSVSGVAIQPSARRETARYSLVAWAMGSVPVSLPDIIVHDNDKDSAIPFTAPSVFVQSVLPADTSLRVPKPAKNLFPRIVPWWELWWPVLIVVLLLALLALFVMRRRRRRNLRVELDPFQRAERDFQRLDQLALGEAGEQGRLVALSLEVLRTYFAARIAPATLALTSDELMTVVAPDSRVPVQRLQPLLIEADAIKFGRYPVEGPRARTFAAEARGVVSAVEQAEQARQLALRAEKKDENKRQKQLRELAEDKARQDSLRDKSEAA